jgi:PAS domain S-box-containing protein
MPHLNLSQKAELRERAQARLKRLELANQSSLSGPDTQRLLHELQVHQIELEKQNEELMYTRSEVEAALARANDLYDFAPVAYLTVDHAGGILQTNVAGAYLLGQERAALLGQSLAGFVIDDDVPAFRAFLEQVFTVKRHHVSELTLSDPSTLQRTVQIEADLSPDRLACRMSLVDLTDRKLLEQARNRAADLEVGRQAAEAASQAKSSFLSRMSHELRTPLNAILGFGQLLQMDEDHVLGELQGERVASMMLAGRHLLALIEDVLDLSHVESGLLRMNIVPIMAQTVLDEALLLVAPALGNSGLSIVFEHVPADSDEPIMVRADKVRLTQVLVNLLINAIKYNTVNGSIRVVLDGSQPDITCIAVADTGRGMTEAQLARIFEPFNRLGLECSGIPGVGIGLVITKWLVNMMAGRLEVQSQPGKGSRFNVWLPSVCTAPV